MRRFALFIAILTTPVFAQSPTAPALRDRLKTFVEARDMAGVVAVVGRSNGVLAVEVAGDADLEAKVAIRPDTVFRIASMTKPITAAAVMTLVDSGKVNLDEPVEKYLREFRGQLMIASREGDKYTVTKPPRPIRVRDLMTHTSGMPAVPPPGLADVFQKRDRTLAEVVLAYSQRPLDFAPGERWQYSNPGIDTLGRIVEVVAGTPYEQYLKTQFFDPLGMTDTTFYPTAEQQKRVARTYAKKGDALERQDFPLFGPSDGAKYPIPAGGLYSTAADLAKFCRVMLNKGELDGRRYLSREAVAEMTRLQTGDIKCGFVNGMGFGLGFGHVREPQGVTAALSPGSFGHGGAFGTQYWMDPARDQFVVILYQRSGGNADAAAVRAAVQEEAVKLIGGR